MRRPERLAALKSAPPCPDLSPQNRPPFEQWYARVLPLLSPLRRSEFERLYLVFINYWATMAEEGRKSTRNGIGNIIQQEIHDLEDNLADVEPHWTTTPTFYVACVGTVAAIIAAVISFLAWRYPLPAPPPEPPPLASPLPESTPQSLSPAPTPPVSASAPPAPSPDPAEKQP